MSLSEHTVARRVAALLIVSLVLVAFVPLLSADVPVYEVYDTPRKKELHVSDEAFVDCVHRLLRARDEAAFISDAHTGPRQPRIPALIIPVSLDYHDLKTLLCNLTVSVEHLVIIQNGAFAPLTRLLTRLNSSTALAGSFTYRAHPDNTGYASAVNEGLRLSLERAAVPWMLISNTDVRFHPDLLRSLVRAADEDTSRDACEDCEAGTNAFIAALVSPVRSRGSDSGAPAASTLSLQRTFFSRQTSSTSCSERRQPTANAHHGLLFPNCVFDMSAFIVTTSHVHTVGLLDENFYPAYGEDFDYKWRSEAYGFSPYMSPCGGYVHFVNGNLNAADDPLHYRLLKHKSSWLLLWKINRMNYQPFRLAYRRAKWFPRSRTVYVDEGRVSQPFAGRMAANAWALDMTRRQRINDVGEGRRCRGEVPAYNMVLLTQ